MKCLRCGKDFGNQKVEVCNECGYDEPREVLEDGTVLYEHIYECNLGHECSIDLDCFDYTEEK